MTDRIDPTQDEPMAERDTDQLLADWFTEDAPKQEPAILLPAVLARTAMTKRRPRWLTRDWRLSVLGPGDRSPPPMMLSVGFVAVLTALALVAAFALVPGGDPDTPPDTIVVAADGSGDFPTIGEGVLAAEDDTIILIKPGRYVETIDTSRSLTFRGGGEERSDVVVKGERTGTPAIRTTNTDTTVEHLTIEVSDPSDSLYDESAFLPGGIEIIGGSATVGDVEIIGHPIAGCGLVIEAGRVAAAVRAEMASTVRNVHIRDGAAGLCSGSGSGGALNVEESTFEGLDTAMRLAGDSVALSGNSFVLNDQAVTLQPISADVHVVVNGNTFATNGSGVLADRGRVDVLDNRFDGGDVAIEYERGAAGRIAGNTIEGAGTGVVIRDSSPTIEDNDISDSSWRGLSIEGMSEPTLTDNTICDNGENLASSAEVDLQIDDTNEICG